jgi:hypothetical protein
LIRISILILTRHTSSFTDRDQARNKSNHYPVFRVNAIPVAGTEYQRQ